MTALRANLGEFWRRLSRLDLVALALVLAGGAAWALEAGSRIWSFVQYLAILSAIYLCFRLIAWSRSRLLWSLRNRLIVAVGQVQGSESEPLFDSPIVIEVPA